MLSRIIKTKTVFAENSITNPVFDSIPKNDFIHIQGSMNKELDSYLISLLHDIKGIPFIAYVYFFYNSLSGT